MNTYQLRSFPPIRYLFFRGEAAEEARSHCTVVLKALVFDIELARIRARAPKLSREGIAELTLDLSHARRIARALIGTPNDVDPGEHRARALALALDHAHHYSLDLDVAHAHIVDQKYLHVAHTQVLDLTRDFHLANMRARHSARGKQQRRAARITPAASRILIAAARLLPPADRPRYREEYDCELWEIAQAGAQRRQQLQYAVRQLLRAAQVRAAVLAPRRRNASP